MLVQIRTNYISLKKFLYGCRVPEIDSPMCNCGGGEETAEHVSLLCPLESDRRHLLFDKNGRLRSWEMLLGSPILAPRLTRWFIESERIKQLSLARKLLYLPHMQDN